MPRSGSSSPDDATAVLDAPGSDQGSLAAPTTAEKVRGLHAARTRGAVTFVLNRLASSAVLLLIVTALSFVLISVAPGDPARTILGAEATQADYEELRQRLGLDQSMLTQYWNWASSALRGDLGQSIYSSEPVTGLLNTRLEVTISLVVLSLFVSVVLGVGIGFVSAVRGGLTARALDALSMLGFAMPSFWFGAVLIGIFAVNLQLLPASGYVSFGDDPYLWGMSMVLPVVALSISSVAAMAKQTREVMVEILGAEYIRMAYANGISRRSLLFRHALKNAGIRVVTVLGLQVIALMGGTVLIETVFAMPGLGGLAVEASIRKDAPVLQGVVLLFTTVVVIVNLASDIAYSLLNPKVRSQ